MQDGAAVRHLKQGNMPKVFRATSQVNRLIEGLTDIGVGHGQVSQVLGAHFQVVEASQGSNVPEIRFCRTIYAHEKLFHVSDGKPIPHYDTVSLNGTPFPDLGFYTASLIVSCNGKLSLTFLEIEKEERKFFVPAARAVRPNLVDTFMPREEAQSPMGFLITPIAAAVPA